MKFKLEPLTPPTIQSLRGYYKSKGYLFPSSLISQFYVAIKTKGFVILSGLSGTGKTKLATEITELLRSNVVKYVPEYASEKFIAKNSLFLSVRPDWRDSKPLLGYYNPLSGEYYETELLKFILRAKKDYEKNRKNAMPHIIILDEMNLAHVEYYFAEFLSVLESGRDNSELTRDSIKLHDVDKVAEKQGIPKEIKLPPNLYILGTVNVDETTYMFSPKVLDRAFTIEFRDVDLQGYPPENAENFDWSELQKTVIDDLRRGGKFTAYAKDEINHAVNELKGTQYWKFLNELNKTLEPYDLHFGYRIIDEIALFYKNAKESQEKGVVEFEDDNEIFDLAILMKILPKFHGNRRRLEIPLKSVLKYCLESDSGLKVDELDSEKVKDLLENWQSKQSEFKFKYTAKKVLRMLRQLYEVGFSSFF
ncbi:hypothetical protein DRP04_09315 [Archaeoglobales archaeon]|nr:MAG: hypothetical protein DRP04_09315 [Archaeoglobales archaeon]